jgi:SulP family sulfate permease
MELAGSLGDLGTLLPLAIGMILINGLDPMGIFLSVGLFYIFSGLYFGVTTPVEPMKVVSAYAISTGISASQIQASTGWLFIFLIFIGVTNIITPVGRFILKPVIRGVQLSTGILLICQGVNLMIGSTRFQLIHNAAEPYLKLQSIGPLPLGLLIGVILTLMTLLLLENKRLPAAIFVVGTGVLIGLILGTGEGFDQLRLGIYLPSFLPYGWPTVADFSFALLVLVLPQIPMTVGNAVIANSDLALQYFPQNGQRVTCRALCISMALANLGSFFIGGMAMCQGAGGLASRYRFGARTAGSNLMIGGIFVALSILLGPKATALLYLLPLSVLGVLLVFAGGQLALTLIDMTSRKELFTPILILGITLASNLAVGFIVGIVVAYLLKWKRLAI